MQAGRLVVISDTLTIAAYNYDVFSERLSQVCMHESMGTGGRNYWTT